MRVARDLKTLPFTARKFAVADKAWRMLSCYWLGRLASGLWDRMIRE
jgi:hypothetical protein